MFRLKVWFWTIGLVFIETFTVCVIWNLVKPNPAYIGMLETVFPGFKWLSLESFLLALAECFLYAAWLASSFVFTHNFFYRKHHHEAGTLKARGKPA